MAEADNSTCASRKFQPEHVAANECLMLWDSPDLLRISAVPKQTVRSYQILLAEDNPIDQISIRRLLENQGITVFLAADGRQAAELFKIGLFDMVLLDILMPEMDGFEVAMYIREHEKVSPGSYVPIIALTAYSLKAVYDKCKSVGMNGYLSKPVTSVDLRELFSMLLPDSVELFQK